jgi:hypothetical protein
VRSPRQRRGSGRGCRPASPFSRGRLCAHASTLKQGFCFIVFTIKLLYLPTKRRHGLARAPASLDCSWSGQLLAPDQPLLSETGRQAYCREENVHSPSPSAILGNTPIQGQTSSLWLLSSRKEFNTFFCVRCINKSA